MSDITAGSVGVNVAGIEKELAALWREASRDRQVTRACSWNLVVHTSDEEAFDAMKPVLDEAVRHVPSRVLVLKPRPFASSGRTVEIEAWVSANCQVAPGGGKLLCTEEITVEARGADGQAHLPGLMRALNVPDVPTALWWAGPPPTDTSATRLLLAGVDRLIFDSDRFRAPDASEGGLRRLAHVGGVLDGLVLADLAWLRTASVRSVLASIFDAVGVAPLSSIARVRVGCAATAVPTAKLLLGWLASRLAWGAPERTERGALSWSVAVRDGQRVQLDVAVEAMGADARTSGIASLALETRSHQRFALRTAGAAAWDVDCAGLSPRTTAATEPTSAQLLVAALGSRGRDRLYPVALHRAVELDR